MPLFFILKPNTKQHKRNDLNTISVEGQLEIPIEVLIEMDYFEINELAINNYHICQSIGHTGV